MEMTGKVGQAVRMMARTGIDPPGMFEGVDRYIGEGGYLGDTAGAASIEEEDIGMAKLGHNIGMQRAYLFVSLSVHSDPGLLARPLLRTLDGRT